MVRSKLLHGLTQGLRWGIVLATAIFLGLALWENWQAVQQLRLRSHSLE